MYPNEFFGLFPAFPTRDEIFVAMSFEVRCQRRWENVLKPALEDSRIADRPLKAKRVDISRAGTSILTEILARIGSSLLFVADITALDQLNGRAIRNANVLYEVGLAHARRLPEEVLLFRSDTSPLDFDVANVRVHSYDPDGDPRAAVETIIQTAHDSLSELDLRRHLAVARAAARLDAQTFQLLLNAAAGVLEGPQLQTVGQLLEGGPRLAAIRRLHDMGALETDFLKATPESANTYKDLPLTSVFSFRLTSLGRALLGAAFERMGVAEPGVFEAVLGPARAPIPSIDSAG
jgi:hypothetical protein